MTDVIVVGGGVVGLSIAWELAGQGVCVRVSERGELGREASWAGAGMLPPGNPEQAATPEARLRAASHVRWADLSAELFELTGIDNGYRNTGSLEVHLGQEGDALSACIDRWREEGVQVEELSAAKLADYEPGLNRRCSTGFYLPEMSQVRNPRHLKALIAGCAARGVEFSPGAPVIGFDRQQGRIVSVRTPDGNHSADRFCIAGGAWSRQILAECGCDLPVEPIHGQIVLLSVRPGTVRHIVQVGSRYLVPRPDGRLLVGSTEEQTGFRKQNTAGAVAELIRFATDLVPELAASEYECAWSGLRPASADGLPYLGAVPEYDNLFVAAGHFRSGLQMSPATAVLMRQVLLDEPPEISLDAYACDRHGLALREAGR